MKSGQEWLIAVQEKNKGAAWLKRARVNNEKVASIDGILKTMLEYNLDFIVSATDGPISSISALAGKGLERKPHYQENVLIVQGCPTANVPLGYLEPSGRPFGLTFVAKAREEAKLLEVLSVYEATFPRRRLPPVLYELTSLIS